jgi:hypothetical protein
MRYPVGTNFQTRVTDGGVEVTFSPTNSIITYYRLADPKDNRQAWSCLACIYSARWANARL